MATRRKALGRGLGALIPPREAGPTEATDGKPLEIEVGRIAPNPDQPRRRFRREQLEALAASIRTHGILQPVVVRRAVREGDDERFELVVGERRWRAARAAGLERIPAVVAEVADRDRLEVALVENVQRDDLNPIELALAFATLAEGGATQEKIGERVGLDRSTVANHIRLLELPRELQEDVESGNLSVGHAKALLSVTNPERRRHLRDRIVGDGLSVREAEQLGRSAGPARRRRRREAPADPERERLIDLLRDRLKTRIRIQGGAGRGRIEIEYFGSEDLNRIVSAILHP